MPDQSLSAQLKLATGFRVLGWLSIVVFACLLVVMAYPVFSDQEPLIADFKWVALVAVVIVTLLFLAAHGLARGKVWGRALGIFNGFWMLYIFPIGTMVAIYFLWQLTLGWPRESGSGSGSGQGS